MHTNQNPNSFIPELFLSLRKGYSFQRLRADCTAGITVALVALPLAMALAIASGVPPEQGLYTAIVAGFIISALGGSHVQVGGPTGAFIVVVSGVVYEHGYTGLACATLMAGVMLLALGWARMGNIIQFIPYPVTTGFTTGIALIIFSSQVPDFLGIDMHPSHRDLASLWLEIIRTLSGIQYATVVIGGTSLFLLLLSRRVFPKFPAALPVVVFMSGITALFGVPVETIASRFGDLRMGMPPFHLPFSGDTDFGALLPAAFTIAVLAGIESLLSAVVADGMTGKRHRPNCELVAQGVANIASSCFSGIPATGAIARTATNVKSGATSPIAGMAHALFLLLFLVFLAPWAKYIPLATLAGILFLVAWNMSELDRFFHLFRAPRSDQAVLVITFMLTIFVDLITAVEIGVVLAALLFMKRMSEVYGDLIPLDSDEEGYQAGAEDGSREIEVFELHGPFFFGVADRLSNALRQTERFPKVFILRMRNVPFIDATALHALEDFGRKLERYGAHLVLCEVKSSINTPIRSTIAPLLLPQPDLQVGLEEALAFSKKLLEREGTSNKNTP